MGSVGDAPILCKNEEILPESAIEELTGDVGCRVVVKGRVEDEQYKEAIDRWNHTGIKDAVSAMIILTTTYFDLVLTKTRRL
jgi:hypothetical protein